MAINEADIAVLQNRLNPEGVLQLIERCKITHVTTVPTVTVFVRLLMYRESEVVVSTMLELKRKHGVPSLAVHDSIIVPQSKADRAAEVLTEQFQKVAGTTPQLVVQSSKGRIAIITQ